MFDGFKHVSDRLDDYVHGVLTPDEAAQVEGHCEACSDCRAELEAAERRLREYRSLPPVEASEQLIQNTLRRVDRHDRLRRVRGRFLMTGLVAAAASVLLLIGVQTYYSRLTAGDFDLRVLGQSELLAGSNASVRVQLFDRKTGDAVGGVPVTVELRGKGADWVHLASFKTDANGTGRPQFEVPDWNETCELRVVASLATPGSDSTARQAVQESVTRSVSLKRSSKVMLSTDKPVYQPGQEIQVRALAMRKSDRKPVVNEPLVFSITDAKGNVIYKSKETTSAYGIAACRCLLATEVIEGAYAVTCKLGDTESRQTVDVKKYVLPKFKVDVQLDKDYYAPGERLQGKVKAAYFFGKPVADGTVTVQLLPEQFLAPQGHKVETRTDANGAASFTLQIPPTLHATGRHGDMARVHIKATVRDQAEQIQERSISRMVSAHPMHIDVLPENGTLVPNVPNTIYLVATYPDGRPVPGAIFSREGHPGPEIAALLGNDLGVAAFTFTPRSGRVDWTVGATDRAGKRAALPVRLHIGQGMDDFLLRTDRAVYNGGDTVHVDILGGGPGTIYLDVIRDGQTLVTDTVELKDGKASYALDLTPELSGALELCAYRFNADGLPVRKARLFYVRPANQVKVTAKADREEYRPGKPANVRFTLTDANGKPVQGALSLAAVDEAVFSVREQSPGMERTFFTLEKEFLKPVYTVYPNWSPDFRPNLPPDEVNRFEQAIFAPTSAWTPVTLRSGGWQRDGIASREVAVEPMPGTMMDAPRRRVQPVHSLAESSFALKEQEVLQRQETARSLVHLGWMLLISITMIAGYAYLWLIFSPRTMVLLTTGSIVMGFCSIGFLAVLVILDVGVAGKKFAAMKDMAAGAKPEMTPAAGIDGGHGGAPRVRADFPETLLWKPQLITDANGEATLAFDLADSITTWRLTASAVTADGQLGATQSGIKVFQPFFVDLNLPVSLTRGDEVAVPVVVYNYLDKPQTVELKLEGAGWFERLGGLNQRLDLGANEVRPTSYRIRVTRAGVHTLRVTAQGDGVSDAIQRSIEVVPDGRRIEQVVTDRLGAEASHSFTIPADSVPDSAKILVKIYPGVHSQVIEGVEGMLQMPHGCFEQTSSSAYPNLLVVDYLKRTRRGSPETLARAEQYLHVGYQRLLTFENQGGGFDWWGKGPPVIWLTAYGLMEFHDMSKVHNVDPNVIQRTQQWLLRQQSSDGTWAKVGPTHGESIEQAKDPRLVLTCYVAWALAESGVKDSRLTKAIEYIRRHAPPSRDAYTLALAANALAAFDPEHASTLEMLQKLDSLRKDVPGATVTSFPSQGESLNHGRGEFLTVETTALAALAMLKVGGHADTVNRSLSYLLRAKQSQGTWGSTSATVLSLKALVRALDGDGKGKSGRFTVAINGKEAARGDVGEFDADVLRLIDLGEHMKVGRNDIVIRSEGGLAMMYQVVARHHERWSSGERPTQGFDLRVDYDRKELTTADKLQARATLRNAGRASAAMVMVELGVPPGFRADVEDFEPLLRRGEIARYSITPRQITLYLTGMPAESEKTFAYRLTPLFPVKAQTPASVAYEYYTPSNRATASPVELTVRAARVD
jgi:hypothetical protein